MSMCVTGDEQLMCLTRKEGRVRWIHQLPQLSDPRQDKSDPIDLGRVRCWCPTS